MDAGLWTALRGAGGTRVDGLGGCGGCYGGERGYGAEALRELHVDDETGEDFFREKNSTLEADRQQPSCVVGLELTQARSCL